MDRDQLARIAGLLRQRNAIDNHIAAIIQRPMTAGHLREWIAGRLFDIELEHSAVARAIDGRFRSGSLQGRTVNVQWYLTREGLLDTTDAPELDYYLVLTGPQPSAMSSRRTVRPWCIESIYLFEAAKLRGEQLARGSTGGAASSTATAAARAVLDHRPRGISSKRGRIGQRDETAP